MCLLKSTPPENKQTNKNKQTKFSADFWGKWKSICWNLLNNVISCTTQAKFWYSENLKIQSNYLLQLDVFFIDYCLHMPEAKWIKQKKWSFDDVIFAMMPFCAKKSEKVKLLGKEKNLNV